jgi:peptidoglycan hydrolase-like protein with peptidoglycan-binding domain
VDQVVGGAPTPPPTPAPQPAPAPQPSGDTAQIKNDQFDLTDTGFDTGGIDGVWGPKSVQACKAFQFAAHLAVDGICGDNTRAALHKVPSWRGGQDGGHPALLWQQKLKAHGWHIELDGVWGAHSASILRQFQQDKGLAVDGVRGPSSWTCLYCTVN